MQLLKQGANFKQAVICCCPRNIPSKQLSAACKQEAGIKLSCIMHTNKKKTKKPSCSCFFFGNYDSPKCQEIRSNPQQQQQTKAGTANNNSTAKHTAHCIIVIVAQPWISNWMSKIKKTKKKLNQNQQQNNKKSLRNYIESGKRHSVSQAVAHCCRCVSVSANKPSISVTKEEKKTQCTAHVCKSSSNNNKCKITATLASNSNDCASVAVCVCLLLHKEAHRDEMRKRESKRGLTVSKQWFSLKPFEQLLLHTSLRFFLFAHHFLLMIIILTSLLLQLSWLL